MKNVNSDIFCVVDTHLVHDSVVEDTNYKWYGLNRLFVHKKSQDIIDVFKKTNAILFSSVVISVLD